MSSPWIQTYSGLRFDLLEPTQQTIDIHDIVVSLARTPRFNAHYVGESIDDIYSVAQHSVLVAEYLRNMGVDPIMQKVGLFHDAHEYVIGDIPTPVQHALDSLCGKFHVGSISMIKMLKDKIQRAIHEKVGLSPAYIDHPIIKKADMAIQATEKRDLMDTLRKLDWDNSNLPEPTPGKIRIWSPSTAYECFMVTLRNITSAINSQAKREGQ